MRTAMIIAATLILTGSVFAQSGPGKFCLRGQSGATQGMENCAYQTMAQCNAAKAGQNDLCVANPGAKKESRSTTGSRSKQ
jgi:hypothetical protein